MKISVSSLVYTTAYSHAHARITIPFSPSQTWFNTFKSIKEFQVAPFIIAVLSMIALIIFKICNKLLQKPKAKVPLPVYKRAARKCITERRQWPIPIPSQLIVVGQWSIPIT